MLLRFLRPIVRLTLWIFYRRIEIHGRDRIPTDRPLILVANHPNVMIDTLILGIHAPGGKIRYLGKSTLFSRPIYAWFLKRLGVIAVSRAEDAGASKIRNRDMLRAVCQTLREGASLVVFPEGASHPEIRLRDLKSGTARIALRVEAEGEGRAGLLIVPVGLTYTDPGTFRSEVTVHYGEVIPAGEFTEVYRRDRDEAEEALTHLIRERLLAVVRHIERRDLEALVREVSELYLSRVEAEFAGAEGVSIRLRAEQEIIRAIHHFEESEPDLVRSLGRRVRGYRRKLGRLGLDGEWKPRPFGFGRTVLALLLAPLAFYGFAHHALPYYLPRLFARGYRESPEMLGTIKMAAGVVLFPLAYAILTGTVFVLNGAGYALAYGLSLPVSGLFTLLYHERVLAGRPLWHHLIPSRRRRRHLQRLADERAELVGELDAIKARYLAPPS